MPLSEHEQHLLEQMEQALYAEDPKFASQMQGSIARARLRRRIAIGALGVIAGLTLVVLGVIGSLVWLGAAGFALMVGGAAYAVTPAKAPKTPLGTVTDEGIRVHRPRATKQAAGHGGRGGRGGRGQTFMQRLEARWDRRRDSWR